MRIKEDSFHYTIIILAIILSGSLIPFIFSKNYSSFLLIFLSFLSALFVLDKNRGKKVISLQYLGILLIFLFFLMFFRFEFVHLKEYLGTLVRLIIATIITLLVSKKKFIEIYVRVLTVYAGFSLILFLLGFLFPDKIMLLPISYNDAGTGYRHIYIYFFQGIESWNFRNAGIFWEAGAFQVYLSLALLFDFYLLEKSLTRKIILILAIVSTSSTIGYAVLALLMIFDAISKPTLSRILVMISFISIFFYFGIYDSFFVNKFDGENISGIDRAVGQLVDIKIFSSSPIFGVGFSGYSALFNTTAYSLGAIFPTSTNSFTGLLALNGIFYSILIFGPMFMFFFRLQIQNKYRILMLCCFIILLSSQGLFNQLLFLIILFYGLQINVNQSSLLTIKKMT
jgi:hypothetical protein